MGTNQDESGQGHFDMEWKCYYRAGSPNFF